ncbi:MAG: hypothetical protein M0R40_07230 [Firmicutes bacterium]|nr:hypothetical protein [Bacillota bacterium]
MVNGSLKIPVKVKLYDHQLKAFYFACEKFGLIAEGGDPIDGSEQNNSPNNLQVLNSQSEHCKIHSFLKRKAGDENENLQK